MDNSLLISMCLSPLLGSVLIRILLRPKSVKLAGILASIAALTSFAISLKLMSEGQTVEWSYEWISLGSLKLPIALRVDRLASIMCVMITGIGSLIHLYSIGYMADDKTPHRYFAYLNFFLFQMLLLVTADTLTLLFVGWEGVGLCSFLLIGYHHEELKNAAAAMKAFIVNRVGDACFLLGIFICADLFQTLTFSKMADLMPSLGIQNLPYLNIAALLLFLGATGKSAQIPLFIWLPDAMAGPTPVSALIHAATMVTAGIYLILRMHFLFEVTAVTNELIAWVGISTALLGASIALMQTDIKKVLAYSTVSQLGLMFLGLGVGGYVASFFHVITHAFFKALLFLGAGSVIHGLHGLQDIRQMGGLSKKLPITAFTMLIGVLAIAGVPPFSGFFSKDAILYSTLFHQEGFLLWSLGLLVSFLTAAYIARLYVLVFLGNFRGEKSIHPHESPGIMSLPLILLAVGSVIAGILELPHGAPMAGLLSHSLSEISMPSTEHPPLSEALSMLIASTVGILGLAVGFMLTKRGIPLVPKIGWIFEQRLYLDELYLLIFVYPFRKLAHILDRVVERTVSSLIEFPASVARFGSVGIGVLQNGSVQFYLFLFLLGSLALFWIQQ